MSMDDKAKKAVEAMETIREYCKKRECCYKCAFGSSDDSWMVECILTGHPEDWVLEV